MLPLFVGSWFTSADLHAGGSFGAGCGGGRGMNGVDVFS